MVKENREKRQKEEEKKRKERQERKEARLTAQKMINKVCIKCARFIVTKVTKLETKKIGKLFTTMQS